MLYFQTESAVIYPYYVRPSSIYTNNILKRKEIMPQSIGLPEAFLSRMRTLPGFDFEAFLRSYDLPPFRGLRVNTLRCDAGHFAGISPFALKKVPFCENGFYIGEEVSGRHPWHHAGVFYLQEPSAMSAVTALGVLPGMRVLDLCAAPGGKSTQIAAALAGKGLLVCNEIVPARAAILLSNIERCGVRNAAVTCEKPERLCARLEGFFDRVLIDAPCSGEGMFRRDPTATGEWTAESPSTCAKRQRAILGDGCRAVSPGGVLVYSTCTFSSEENEGVVNAFIHDHPDFSLEQIDADFGQPARPDWAGAEPELAAARRVFPFNGGEGHFVARMRRDGGNAPALKDAQSSVAKEAEPLFNEFFGNQFCEDRYGRLFQHGDRLYLLPEELPDMKGLNLLRAGVFAGTVKGSRFEPSHALYLACDAASALRAADFALEDGRLADFLHGEQVEAPAGCAKGYVCVKAQGFAVGFGKVSDGALKNHYPKGLRNL
jgi:NOL1/NOP2/sun family putative RNA methylase